MRSAHAILSCRTPDCFRQYHAAQQRRHTNQAMPENDSRPAELLRLMTTGRSGAIDERLLCDPSLSDFDAYLACPTSRYQGLR